MIKGLGLSVCPAPYNASQKINKLMLQPSLNRPIMPGLSRYFYNVELMVCVSSISVYHGINKYRSCHVGLSELTGRINLLRRMLTFASASENYSWPQKGFESNGLWLTCNDAFLYIRTWFVVFRYLWSYMQTNITVVMGRLYQWLSCVAMSEQRDLLMGGRTCLS